MDSRKVRTSLLAVVAAAAVALSGTFAWQSISQVAVNEAANPINPGGRLHDDFSGYGEGTTKDIYVENFGDEPIYARVRLDEYMEIGTGAGQKDGDPGYASKSVRVLAKSSTNSAQDADIDDPTTWTTHLPGATSATTGEGTETGFNNPAETFHTYWKWVMGGQASDNWSGETVYMPTFNKNKDSLKADVNGTLEGTTPGDNTHYDDYVNYIIGDPVTGTETADEYYDADVDNYDECGPDGGPGGVSGVLNTNYAENLGVTHTAANTLTAKVITMAEYTALPDADKETLLAWVYDVDGWAYWSQAIEPETATGLLLDRLELLTEPDARWYYAINAVAQFITADSLGRLDSPGTGFYAGDGPDPTPEALDLLDGIGVNISKVSGAIQVSAKNNLTGSMVSSVTPGMSIDLTAVVTVANVATPDQSVTWKVKGAVDPDTVITVDASGTVTLTVGAGEPDTGTLTIEASSAYPDYAGLKGKLVLPVGAAQYSVALTRMVEGSYEDDTTVWYNTYYPNSGSDAEIFTTADADNRINYTDYSGTSFKVTATDTVLLKAEVLAPGTGLDTSGATVTFTCDDPAVSLSATTMTTPASGTHLKPTGNTGMISVSLNGASAGVKTITATATLSDNTTSVTACVPIKLEVSEPKDVIKELVANGKCGSDLGGVVNIDGTDFYILKTLTGGATFQDSNGATVSDAALLFTKDQIAESVFDDNSVIYDGSTAQTIVNDWVNDSTNRLTLSTNAIPVDLKTRTAYDDNTNLTTSYTQRAFLLSIADVYGVNGSTLSQNNTETNSVGDMVTVWSKGDGSATAPLVTDELTPGVEKMGELWKLIPDGRSLRHGAQWWWLRTPRCSSVIVGVVNWGYASGEAGVLNNGRYDTVDSGRYGGLRPALWYDLSA